MPQGSKQENEERVMIAIDSKKITVALAGLAVVFFATGAQAGTLENLERERALLVELMLDPGIDAEERAQRMNKAKHRLVDLERMALRDRSLRGQTTPIVRKAFESYDLTFLVHASVEKDRSLTDQWLGEVGITTEKLMAARDGKR